MVVYADDIGKPTFEKVLNGRQRSLEVKTLLLVDLPEPQYQPVVESTLFCVHLSTQRRHKHNM